MSHAHRVNGQSPVSLYYTLAERFEREFKLASKKAHVIHDRRVTTLIGKQTQLEQAYAAAAKSLHARGAREQLQKRHAEIQAFFGRSGPGSAGDGHATPSHSPTRQGVSSASASVVQSPAPVRRVGPVSSPALSMSTLLAAVGPRGTERSTLTSHSVRAPSHAETHSAPRTHSASGTATAPVSSSLPRLAPRLDLVHAAPTHSGSSRPLVVAHSAPAHATPLRALVLDEPRSAPVSGTSSRAHTPPRIGESYSQTPSSPERDRVQEQAELRQTLQQIHSLQLAIRQGSSLSECFARFTALSPTIQHRIYQLLCAYFGHADSVNVVQDGIALFLEDSSRLNMFVGGGRKTILDMVKEEMGASQSQRTPPRSSPSSTPPRVGNPEDMDPDTSAAIRAIFEQKKKAPKVHVKYDRLLTFLTTDDNRYCKTAHGDFGIQRGFGILWFNPNSPGDKRFQQSIQGTHYYTTAMRAFASSPYRVFLTDTTRLAREGITCILCYNWGSTANKAAVYRLLKEVVKYCIVRDNTRPTDWDHLRSYEDALNQNSARRLDERREMRHGTTSTTTSAAVSAVATPVARSRRGSFDFADGSLPTGLLLRTPSHTPPRALAPHDVHVVPLRRVATQTPPSPSDVPARTTLTSPRSQPQSRTLASASHHAVTTRISGTHVPSAQRQTVPRVTRVDRSHAHTNGVAAKPGHTGSRIPVRVVRTHP